VKVKFTVEQAMLSHRGVRVHFTPGRDMVLIVQEVEWAPGPVSTGAENLTPTGI